MKPYFKELAVSHLKIKTRLPDTYVRDKMMLNGSRRKVELMEPEIVVPGHGDPGGVDIIR